MAEIKVTYARMNETADIIASSTREYLDRASEAKTIMESLRGMWESDAAESFRAKVTQLDTIVTSHEKLLNEYAEFLRKAAAEYQNIDTRIDEQTNVLDASALL